MSAGRGGLERRRSARLARKAEAGDHLAQFLAVCDVAESDLAEMAEVEQGQALGEKFAIDDALAEPRDDAEADPPRQFVERGADTAHILRFDILKAVAKHDPVDACPCRLGLLGAAAPDQLRIEARQIGRASCRERVCQYV